MHSEARSIEPGSERLHSLKRRSRSPVTCMYSSHSSSPRNPGVPAPAKLEAAGRYYDGGAAAWDELFNDPERRRRAPIGAEDLLESGAAIYLRGLGLIPDD